VRVSFFSEEERVIICRIISLIHYKCTSFSKEGDGEGEFISITQIRR